MFEFKSFSSIKACNSTLELVDILTAELTLVNGRDSFSGLKSVAEFVMNADFFKIYVFTTKDLDLIFLMGLVLLKFYYYLKNVTTTKKCLG